MKIIIRWSDSTGNIAASENYEGKWDEVPHRGDEVPLPEHGICKVTRVVWYANHVEVWVE